MGIPNWNVTRALAIKLRNLTAKSLPVSLLNSFNTQTPQPIPPLPLPHVDSTVPHLLQLGLSPDYANLLHHELANAVDQLDNYLSDSYHRDAQKFLETAALPNRRSLFVQALQDHLLRVRAQFVQTLLTALQSRAEALIQQSRSIHTTSQPSVSSSSPPSTSSAPPSSSGAAKPSGKPRGRAPKFTKEQTAALNALLVYDNQYSPEDKELIAHELNLTREQVNRWFCNARARKKPYSGPSRRPTPSTIKSLSSNTNSSSLTDTPSTQVEQNQSLERPSTSSSDDTEMTITASSSSSSQGEEDDPMNAYFDFPAYQPESWSQQDATPLSVPPISFNFDYLNPSACSTLPHPSSSFADPQLWNQPTFNSQPFPY